MRASVEEADLVFRGHLIAQAQGPLDGYSGVAEVGVVEDLAALAVGLPTVELDDLGDLAGGHVPALVAEVSLVVLAAACGPNVARIEELDLSLAPLVFTIGDDPDVRANARVVEHL